MKNRSNKHRLNKKTDGDSPIHVPGQGTFIPESQLFFNRNMQALKKFYPEIADLVEKTPESQNFDWMRTGSRKLPNLKLKPGNSFYYDLEDPINNAGIRIKELQLKNTRLAFFLGMGLGYELLYYVENIANTQNTSHILVIEKYPELFKAALKSVDLVKFIENPGFCFMVGVEESVLYTKLWDYLYNKNRFMFLKAMKPVYHPSSIRLSKEYYFKALQALRDAAAQVLLHFGNDPYDSLLGIEHMLANIDEIVSNPGINYLFNKFKDRPGIVVSTGPSLNKNKHLLEGLENKALIIAADASLKVLIAMGFKPHLAVSLERNLPVKTLMEGFSADEVADVYYAACPVIHPEVFPSYPGPRIIVYRDFDHFKWLGIDKGIVPIKVSSGNMAYKIAEVLGCDPIILIGQDLAFSRDGKTHATGTAGTIDGNQDVIHERGGKFEVMGNDGMPIITNPIWYQCLKAYETDIAAYNGTCINSTEGGAYINGTQVMPFQEAIDKYINEEFFPLDIVKKHLSLFTEENEEKDVGKLLELLERTIVNMQEIVDNCKNGLNIYQKYRTELGNCIKNPESIEAIRDRLNDIEKELFAPQNNCSKNYETFQLFFAHVFQSYAINFQINLMAIPEKYEDRNLARIEVMLRSEEWYAVIGDLAAICVQSLEQAKAKLGKKAISLG